MTQPFIYNMINFSILSFLLGISYIPALIARLLFNTGWVILIIITIASMFSLMAAGVIIATGNEDASTVGYEDY